MKKNAVPEISADWWKSNAPTFLSNRKNLETSVASLEKSLTKLEAKPDPTTQQAAMSAYKDVQSATKQLTEEANALLKVSKKPAGYDEAECENTVAALERFTKVLYQCREEIEDAVENIQGDLFGDVTAYTNYLKKILPKILKPPFKPFSFAIGIMSKDKESRILFHKSKEPKVLSAGIKEKLKEADISWGSVKQDEKKPDTLRLVLEGPRVSGAKKRLEKLLKELRITLISEVIFVLDGKELVDQDEDLKASKPDSKTPPPPKSEATSENKTPPPPTPEPKPESKAAPKKSPVEVVKLGWEQLRLKLQTNLRQLEATILKMSEGEPDFDVIATRVKRLYDILDELDTQLLEDLSKALSAAEEVERKEFLAAAVQQIDAYLEFVESDALFLSLDTNPFEPMNIQDSVTKNLEKMRSVVAAAATAST
ncbi:MAG: hypothetical protein ACKO6N_00500 [Myxococcota bacterium]